MSTNVRSRWLLGATLLVLAGLFGMHGLGDHPAMDHPTTAMAHASHVEDLGDRADGADSGALAAAPAGDAAPMGPMALCVAVLLGGVLSLLLVLQTRRRESWALPRPALLRLPVPRGRDPDPPTHLVLSIWRC